MKLNGLKEKRKSKKITQTQMAKILNVSVRNYRAYEEGVNKPPMDFLEKVEQYFDCKIKDLK